MQTRVQGDEFYLGLLDELAELHLVKSDAYGSPEDAFANFTRVAVFTGEPAFRYPLLRALEKQARLEELTHRQRFDELESELTECASLFLSAEALRRRVVLRPVGSPLGRRGAALPLFADRLRELAATVDTVGLSESASAFDVDRQAAEREPLCGALDGRRPSEPRCLFPPHPRQRGSDQRGSGWGPDLIALLCSTLRTRRRKALVGATAHTPCKSPLFRLTCSFAEILSRRLCAAGVEGYDWRRTASPSPASRAGPVEGCAAGRRRVGARVTPTRRLVEANDESKVAFFEVDREPETLVVISGRAFPDDRDLPGTGEAVTLATGTRVIRGTVRELAFVVEVGS